MDNDIKTWLYDILNSINELESYYTDAPKMFEMYQNDFKKKEQLKEISKLLVKQWVTF